MTTQCEQCGKFFDTLFEAECVAIPMYCPGCEDWLDWLEEEDKEKS